MNFRKTLKKVSAAALAAVLALGGVLPAAPVKAQAEELDLSDGLVGYWTFDDGAGIGKNSAEGGTDAEIMGSGITASDEGVLGKSAHFDGTYSYLKVPDCINTKKEAVSFSFWTKADESAFASAMNMTILQQSGTGRTILYLNPSKKFGTFLAAADKVCAQSVELGQWYHVAAVSSPLDKTYQFYLNGQLINTEALSDNYVDALTDLYIGVHKAQGTSNSMKGLLDELRFYKKALSSEEVKAIFDQEKAGLGWEDPDDSKPVNITVKPEAVKKTLSPAMFGINHRYHLDGVSSWDTESNRPFEAFDQITRKSAFGSVRYPGGAVANLFEWKRSIGPKEERIDTIHGAANYNQAEPIVPNFGLNEAAGYICDDLDSELVYVYGMGRGSAQDAADLVEYLNSPNDGSNPGGGVDWAAARARNGHNDPYGVTYFELGNELNVWGQDYWLSGRPSGTSLTHSYLEGGTMTFTDQQVVGQSDWRTATGKSDGKANQVKYTKYMPVTPDSVQLKVGGTAWTRVEDLSAAGAENVFTIEGETGKITFGDGTHGSIPAANAQMTISYASEQEGYRDYLAAMKAVDSSIKVYSCLSTDEFINADVDYDGIVEHPYAAPSAAEKFYEESLNVVLTSAIPKVKEVQNKIRKAKGEDTKADIAVSEFGLFRSTNELLKTQTNALSSALEIIEMTDLDVAYSNRHCLIDYPSGDVLGPGQQAVIQAAAKNDGSGTYDYVSTPSAKLYELLAGMASETVVESEVGNNPRFYANVDAVHTLATKDDSAVYLVALNLYKDQDKETTIEIEGQDLTDKRIEVWTLDGDSYDAQNTVNDPDHIKIEKKIIAGNDSRLTYTLTPHSITGFKITGEGVSFQDLSDRIAQAKELQAEDYTQESFEALTNAIQEAEKVTEGASVDEILQVLGLLEQAVTDLVKAGGPDNPDRHRDNIQTEYWEKEKGQGTLAVQTEDDVWHYQIKSGGTWSDIPEAGYSSANDAWLHATDENTEDPEYYWARIGKNHLVPCFGEGNYEGVAYSWKAEKTGYVKVSLAKNLRLHTSTAKDNIDFTIAKGTKSADSEVLTRKTLPVGSQSVGKEDFTRITKIQVGDYIRFSAAFANNDVFDVEPVIEEADVRDYAEQYYEEVKDAAAEGNYTQESVQAFEAALKALEDAMNAPQAVEAVIEGAIRNLETAVDGLTEDIRAAVTGITLNKKTIALEGKGTAETLKASVQPANATEKRVQWSSSNPAVAAVSETGTVTAVSDGTVTIKAASVENNSIFAECEVTVTIPDVPVIIPVTGITLDRNAAVLNTKGETLQLKETVQPANATNQKVLWKSSNPAVASVSESGLVTAMADGTTVITAVSEENAKIMASCDVKVSIPVPVITRQVVFDANGGAASKDRLTVTDGSKIGTLPTAKRDGYEFLGWFTAREGGSRISQDTVITGNLTVYAQWKQAVQTPAKIQKKQTSVKIATVTWKKLKNASRYEIYRKIGNGKYKKTASLKGSKSSYTSKGLEYSKKYKFKVVAKTKSKDKKTLKAKVSYKKKVTMTWTNVSGYEGYDIFVKEGKGKYKNKKTVKKGGKITYAVKLVPMSKKYKFQLKGYTMEAGRKVYKVLG